MEIILNENAQIQHSNKQKESRNSLLYLFLLLLTDMRVISRKLKYAKVSMAIAIKNSVGS